MDNLLIFRYRHEAFDDGATQEDRVADGWKSLPKHARESGEANPPGHHPEL